MKQIKKKRNVGNELDIYREVDAQKMFHHPNIVKLHELIDDDDEEKLYLLMDFCPCGEVMKFNEATMMFRPPDVLVEQQAKAVHFFNGSN
jgi:serine/threonine protein kinase